MDSKTTTFSERATTDQYPFFKGLNAPPSTHNDLSRRQVRALIFHLLYAAEAFDYKESAEGIIDNFNRGFDLTIPVDGEVCSTVQAIIDQRDKLDNKYQIFLNNWRFERIEVSSKLILRFAVWELEEAEIDPRIIINEAVELAKCFADDDAYRFINGVLDKFIHAPE